MNLRVFCFFPKTCNLTHPKNYANFIRPRLNPCCDYVLVCRNGKQISKLRNIFGRIVFLAIGKYKQTCRYDIDKQTSQTCLSEDQKHMSNVTKIHYQKLRSEYVAMKTKSCLEKLQESSKSSEQLAAVNKTTHSSNKIDFEKDEPSKQGLRQKNQLFQIVRIISHAKGSLNMIMVVGLLYYMVPASNFTHLISYACT